MKYRVHKKIWSLGDTFRIQDDACRDVFLVRGRIFSWGDKLSFQDSDGRELAVLSEKLLGFGMRYKLYRGGAAFAEIGTAYGRSYCYTLDVRGQSHCSIQVSRWDHGYVFQRGGVEVARATQFDWYSYGIGIVEGEDDIAILATSVVVHHVTHPNSG